MLGLEDSYDYKALGPNSASGSLIDLCKFAVEQKDIGLLSDKKEISEAIVLIPYADHGNSTDDGYANATRGREIYGDDAHTCYFDIDVGVLSDLLGRNYSHTSALEIVNILKTRNSEKLETNSILNLMKKMDKYILPPHLDWLHSKEIAPFAMYIIEFNHYLDREDLSNIWQGLSPKITNNAERKINSFEHDLDEKNLFHGKKIPEGTRFKIFRIKRRANADYKQITAKKHKKAKHIKEIQTKAKLKINFDDENKIITIITPGKNSITFDDKAKEISIEDQNKNTIVMSSTGIAFTSDKDIKLTAKGSITLSATSKLTLSAKQDASIEGLNVKLTAKAGLTAKGTSQAEFSSGGQTVLKGALVNIN